MSRSGRPPGWSAKAPISDLIREIVGPPERLRGALREAAEVLAGEWREVLSGAGEGELYEAGTGFVTVGGRTFPVKKRKDGSAPQVRLRQVDHRASKPGDAPAMDSGATAASIGIDDGDPDELRVGSNRRTLLALEFGVNVAGSKVGEHPGGIVIEPRPSMEPALEAAEPGMREAFRRGMTRA